MKTLLLSLAITATLAACATPAIQSPGLPPTGFAGPSIDGDAFVSFDGARGASVLGGLP